MTKIRPTKDKLKDLYVNKELNLFQIADIFKVGKSTVYRWLKKDNTSIRPHSESFRGRKHTEETKRKMREYAKNRVLPDDFGERVSRGLKGKYGGVKNPFYGKKHTEETRRKMRENHADFRGEKHHNYGKPISEETREKIRRARRKQKIPTSNTKPERKLMEIIKKYGLNYKYTGDGAFWIENINPDFVESNGRKIAIEVFGDYWHSPLLNRKLRYNQTFEGRKTILKKYGWDLIVLWESEIMNEDSEDAILAKISSNG